MRPTRGLGSAPLPPANRGCTLLLGLAPGRVCRVSLRSHRPEAGPVGIVTVALVLASRRTGVTRYPALRSSDFPRAATRPKSSATRGHPAASLAAPILPAPRRCPGRPQDDRGGPAAQGPVDGLVAQRVGGVVLGPSDVIGRPAVEGPQQPQCLRVERLQLGVLHPPAAVELLHDEQGVEEQPHLARPELTGEGEGPHDRRVLGDVVGLDAEVVRDRGVGRSARVERVGPDQVDQDRPGRGMAGVGPRRAVRADDEAAGLRRRPFELGPERVVQSFGPEGSSGSSAPAREPALRPRSFRQAHWSGS